MRSCTRKRHRQHCTVCITTNDLLLPCCPCLPACSLAVPACCQTAGAEQAPLVQQLLQSLQEPGAGSSCAFTNVTIHEDCYGVPRFVSATRSSLG